MKAQKPIFAELSTNHWTVVDYKQRMTYKEWKEILLQNKDSIIYMGHMIPLKATKLGFGLVDVQKDPEKLNEILEKMGHPMRVRVE